MSILEDIYFGEYSANEKNCSSKAYKDIYESVKYFRNKLEKNDIYRYNKMLDNIFDLGARNDFDSYKNGIKFGICLMNDIL